MNNLLKVTAVAAVAWMTAASAHASTMDFDGTLGDMGTLYPSGGPNGSYYQAGDYVFSPANVTSAQQCYEDNCVQEFTNGSVGELTRVDSGAFNFLGFYFNLTGNGLDKDNFVLVEAFNGAAPVGTSLKIALADVLSGFLPNFSVTYANASDPNAACKDDQNVGFDKTVKVCNQKGYFVSVLNGYFDDVTKIRFTSSSSAELRIDDLHMSEVPLPAAGWLLLAGIGGLAAYGRKKRAA